MPRSRITRPTRILAASQLVAQLHTIVSRRIDPGESAVLSVTRIEGGHSHNVLPAEVSITGTVRSFDAASQDRIEAALRATVDGVALASGTQAEVRYVRYYPATVNTRGRGRARAGRGNGRRPAGRHGAARRPSPRRTSPSC